MIRDATALAEVRQSWGGVEALRSRLQVSAFASVGVLGGSFPFVLANAAHNLPFIHAYAVLNDVLEQRAAEGHFNCKSIFLGELLKKSEKVRWLAYARGGRSTRASRRRQHTGDRGAAVDSRGRTNVYTLLRCGSNGIRRRRRRTYVRTV